MKQMADRRRVLLLSVLVLTGASIIVTGLTSYFLYHAALDEERGRLVETATSQARLIEAVARFDAKYSQDYPEGTIEATLSQIREAHARHKHFGRTSEFTLAKREGDDIVFLMRHYPSGLGERKPVPFSSELAEPMRRALSGQSGTIIGLDYRGEKVLAAYEPVAELNIGIVAKIDFSEIREPFIRAGIYAGVVMLVVVLIGSLLFLRVTNPFIMRLEETVRKRTNEVKSANVELQKKISEHKRAEEELRRYEKIVSTTQELMLLVDRNYIYRAVNKAYLQAYNKKREEVIGHSVQELAGGDDFTRLIKDRMDQCLKGEKVHFQSWFDYPGLDRRYMDAVYYPFFEEDGSVSGVVVASRDITERARAEEALRTSEKEKALILDSTAELVVYQDTEMKVLWANKAAAASIDQGLDDLIGRQCYELWHHRSEPCPECPVILARQTGQPQTGEIISPDGRVWFIRGYPVLSDDGEVHGLVEFTLDITERKRAEEKLEESEERYRSMMEALSDPAYICSSERLVEYMNPAMIQWAGGEAIGEPCHKVAYGLDERCDWCVHDRIMQGEAAKTEVVNPKDHRSYIVAHSPIFHTDGSVSKMTIFTDVTDRKQAEEALRKKEAARAAAEEADRAKSEFLAVMSHELRTPLTGVLGFAQTMRRVAERGGLTPEKQSSYLNSITEAGEHLAAVIDDLLDISKIEAGQVDIHPESIDLREVLDNIHSNLAGQYLKKGLGCEIDVPEGFPLVWADKKRLTQIMLNLWGNAVKFTEQGSVRIRASAPEKSDQLLISISDSGPGIAPEYLDQIFEKFKQARAESQGQTPGTGLGLAIAKQLVELMGGTIWVKSVPGQGSDFRFTLSRWREEEEWKTRA